MRLTAEEFESQRFDLPEAGRWHELHEGQPVLLSAPEAIHGTIVLNLSRLLAQWFAAQPARQRGYACFGLGITAERSPDTVYMPAISVFLNGVPFSQTDRTIASEVPCVIIDIASSNDRRTDMRRRTTSYLQHGVSMIWVPDPFKKEIQVIRRNQHTLALGAWQNLEGGTVLPGFTVAVADVFAEPKWWDGKLPECSVIRDDRADQTQ
ncbi:MAG: Uma2 family endonuclease [Planctomycetia bacterium]